MFEFRVSDAVKYFINWRQWLAQFVIANFRSEFLTRAWFMSSSYVTKRFSVQMATSDSNNSDLSGLTNHKRSHSFNNHQSYTQHSQHSQKSKQKNQSAGWLLNSCDSLDQSPAKPNRSVIGKKFSSVDFIDTSSNYVTTKGTTRFSLRQKQARFLRTIN